MLADVSRRETGLDRLIQAPGDVRQAGIIESTQMWKGQIMCRLSTTLLGASRHRT